MSEQIGWEEWLAQGMAPDTGPNEIAERYEAAFSTPAGQAVLRHLYQSFVNVTRWNPGEDVAAAYYREGQASMVHHIAAMIDAAKAEREDGKG